MNLTPHFSLAELTRSQIAARHGIDNTPPGTVIENLRLLCNVILEPVRALLARPVIITSGYRSLPVNRILKSKDTSQHVTGEAADIECPGIDNLALARMIRDAVPPVPFDQLILEFHTPGNPSSGWVHVSVAAAGITRRQVLTIDSAGARPGLPDWGDAQ